MSKALVAYFSASGVTKRAATGSKAADSKDAVKKWFAANGLILKASVR